MTGICVSENFLVEILDWFLVDVNQGEKED